MKVFPKANLIRSFSGISLRNKEKSIAKNISDDGISKSIKHIDDRHELTVAQVTSAHERINEEVKRLMAGGAKIGDLAKELEL